MQIKQRKTKKVFLILWERVAPPTPSIGRVESGTEQKKREEKFFFVLTHARMVIL